MIFCLVVIKNVLSDLSPCQQNQRHFLDHVIKPSVTSNDGSSCDKLLNVMEDSDHQGVKELAKLIRTKRSNSDNG